MDWGDVEPVLGPSLVVCVAPCTRCKQADNITKRCHTIRVGVVTQVCGDGGVGDSDGTGVVIETVDDSLVTLSIEVRSVGLPQHLTGTTPLLNRLRDRN